MTAITVDRIGSLDAEQLHRIVAAHEAAKRARFSAEYLRARVTIAGAPEFAAASAEITEEIVALFERVGYTGGRNTALATIRWTVLADRFRELLSDEEHRALTASFDAAAVADV
ncbi:hypothetical protein ROT00_10815 [Agromyces mediolanus]|uniref:hypothetical protein n=1 Tax=Agromyces mediolanus TaxID=41986 RepID=UPI0038324CF4